MVAGIWLVTFSTTIVFYEVLCFLYYDDVNGFLVFTDTPFCTSVGWYADFSKNFAVVVTIVIIDVWTVLIVRRMNGTIKPKQNNAQIFSKFSKRESNFLKQTVFQGSIFAIELITYFFLPPYLSDPWSIFFCTSFAWVLVHAADGVVTMVFNPEFKKCFMTIKRGVDCHMYYDDIYWTFIYTYTEQCQQLTFIADFVVHLGMVFAMIILNSLTFVKMKKSNETVRGTVDRTSSNRKIKAERNFLRQMFYQGTIYTIALLTYFFISRYINNQWLRFFIIILPWVLIHAFDGCVTIVCNPDLKNLCLQTWNICGMTTNVPNIHIWTMERDKRTRKWITN